MRIRSAVLEAVFLLVASGCSDASTSPSAAAEPDAASTPVVHLDATDRSAPPVRLSSDTGAVCPADRAISGCACDEVGKTAACSDGGVSTCGQSGEFPVWGPCSCTPKTCVALGASCGSVSDGCGGTLECGTCSAPADPHGSGRITCGGGGTPNVCGCSPLSCKEADAHCGSISDGCGGTLHCGSCTEPRTCGGGGVPNACGCAPTTCAAAGTNCGSVADGCGGTIDCGTCDAPDTCGGGGAPNVCGCASTVTCATASANCGGVADGCGGTIDCGSCSAPQSCGGGGTANQCGGCTTTCYPGAVVWCNGGSGACYYGDGYDHQATETCGPDGTFGPCQEGGSATGDGTCTDANGDGQGWLGDCGGQICGQ